MLKTNAWILKASKLCNLRCTYCYEWNELANKDRMSFDLLRKCFVALRDYHDLEEKRFDRVVTSITWHGGEPLALPIDYLEEAMAIQRDVLGERYLSRSFRNAVQTNAYHVSDAHIEFLRRHDFNVGVSVDVVEGVRVSLGGRTTEKAVFANVERFRRAGIDPSAIVVLARHTMGQIERVHDYLAAKGFTRMRILPLFDGPPERPPELFAVDNAELVDAMCRLFAHWMEEGALTAVAPFEEYLGNVLRKMIGIGYRLVDRRVDGEAVVVVNTNGEVYQINDAYEASRSLGNLGEQTFDAIRVSPRTRASFDRDDALKAKFCGNCEYAGHCNGFPIFQGQQPGAHRGRCPIAYPVHEFIEGLLRREGFDEAELGSMLNAIRAQTQGRASVSATDVAF